MPGAPLFVKAQESLKCARETRAQKWFNSASSRLYYALLQICKELLLTRKNIEYNSGRDHSAIQNAFYGMNDTEIAILLGHLYNTRYKSDYEKVQITDKDLNKDWQKTEDMIKGITKELQNARK